MGAEGLHQLCQSAYPKAKGTEELHRARQKAVNAIRKDKWTSNLELKVFAVFPHG